MAATKEDMMAMCKELGITDQEEMEEIWEEYLERLRTKTSQEKSEDA